MKVVLVSFRPEDFNSLTPKLEKDHKLNQNMEDLYIKQKFDQFDHTHVQHLSFNLQ